MRALVCALLLAAVATPAAARNLMCVMTQPNGVEIEYEFRPTGSDYYVEVRMKKGGQTIINDVPNLWMFDVNPHGTGIHYVKDPQYWIFFDTTRMERTASTIRADAELIRGREPGKLKTLAKGGCGWLTR